MMLTFTHHPYQDASPLVFGMRAPQVAALLGPPKTSDSDYFGNPIEMRPCINLGYDADGGLREIIFYDFEQWQNKYRLLVKGIELNRQPDIYETLCQLNPEVYEHVGFYCFFHLGLKIHFDEDDHENRTSNKVAMIGIVNQGYFEQWPMSSYRRVL